MILRRGGLFSVCPTNGGEHRQRALPAQGQRRRGAKSAAGGGRWVRPWLGQRGVRPYARADG